MEIDLHGYDPSDVFTDEKFTRLVQQAWEMGEPYLRLIHGHGHNRGISAGFVNTNTGYFGLCIRSAFRHDRELRRWIKYSTLDCCDAGATEVKLKPNPNPSRTALDENLLGEPSFAR